MDIEKTSDLMELINSEKLTLDSIDYKKVFLYFCVILKERGHREQ